MPVIRSNNFDSFFTLLPQNTLTSFNIPAVPFTGLSEQHSRTRFYSCKPGKYAKNYVILHNYFGDSSLSPYRHKQRATYHQNKPGQCLSAQLFVKYNAGKNHRHHNAQLVNGHHDADNARLDRIIIA